VINKVTLKNFEILRDIHWENLSKVNLIIGENSSGKSFLLKSLYSANKTVEEFKRGDDNRSIGEILAEKLYWTFQNDKIGDLVSKGEDKLHFEFSFDNKGFSYGFGKQATKNIQYLNNALAERKSNSIFFPSKEVLSLYHIVIKSREQDKMFGFDDTYFDLVKALQIMPKGGRNYEVFANSRKSLEKILGGRIEYDETSKKWQFKNDKNQKFAIGVTFEGIKKIAILDQLLSNRYLDTSSIIFIDEPESALHPSAICQLLDIISALAETGIQFFIASHSYFVIKKLFLIATEKKISIPIISLSRDEKAAAEYNDLKNGLPNNSIIDESIRLYEEEVEEALK